MTCEHCGSAIEEHRYEIQLRACPECGEALESGAFQGGYTVVSPASGAPGVRPAQPRIQTHHLTFTGSAGEYFRIWIVNIFLSVITLGIYNAWAKVRTRQYFYANTQLAGHAFDYLANPLSILKGNLIVGGGFLLYVLLQRFSPNLSYVVVGLFYLVFPFLVYTSIRFKAHYSAYRNIRFRFHGTLKQSYVTYLFLPLLTPLSLGLIIPYLFFRQKKYFFDNFAFGASKNFFSATSRRFYTVYLTAFVMLIGAYVGSFVLGWASLNSVLLASNSSPDTMSTVNFFVVLVLGYLILMLAFSLIQQYIYAQITNYSWANSTLASVRFKSTLKTWPLVKIRLTNLLAMIFSLGLLIPWAKVRYTRYLLDNLAVVTEGDLDSFTADLGMKETALGEVATDFFDLDIGL